MRAPTRGLLGTGEFRGEPRERDVRWNGHAVRVTTPVPTDVWTTVASTDPSTLPFQRPGGIASARAACGGTRAGCTSCPAAASSS